MSDGQRVNGEQGKTANEPTGNGANGATSAQMMDPIEVLRELMSVFPYADRMTKTDQEVYAAMDRPFWLRLRGGQRNAQN